MKRAIPPLLYSCAGAVAFCILLEHATPAGAAVGFASGLVFCLTVRTFARSSALPFSPFRILRYCLHLLFSMAASTWMLIRQIAAHRPFAAAVLHLPPQADADGRILVANSITLTPGTITLEETPDAYTVLCAEAPGHPLDEPQVSGHFETLLLQGGKKRA